LVPSDSLLHFFGDIDTKRAPAEMPVFMYALKEFALVGVLLETDQRRFHPDVLGPAQPHLPGGKAYEVFGALKPASAEDRNEFVFMVLLHLLKRAYLFIGRQINLSLLALPADVR
jgi:hypothetical protein